MNFMQMVTLLQVGYTTVDVVFVPGGKTYTYKTYASLAKDDTVVVDVPTRGLRCVTVVEVHDSPRIDQKAPFEYKWVVQRVDRAAYDEQLRLESEAVAILELAERERARQDVVDKLQKAMPADPVERLRLQRIVSRLTGMPSAVGG